MENAELALDLNSGLGLGNVDQLSGHHRTADMLHLVHFAERSSSERFQHDYILFGHRAKLELDLKGTVRSTPFLPVLRPIRGR